MKKGLFLVRTAIIGALGWLAAAGTLRAEKDFQTMLTEGLQGHSELFQNVPVQKVMAPVDFQITLGKEVLKLENGDEFDGFRFKAPKGAKQLDFVWYFNAPNDWGNWYLCPVKGEVGRSFSDWLNGDKIYQKFDQVDSDGRLRVLQTLGAGYFTGGAEYIMWFRREKDAPNGTLSGRLNFAKTQKDWDYEKIEESLKLKPQDLAAQVEALDSIGGKILLDETFFTHAYADDRIDSVFFSMRQTKRMQSGYFITIEISIPPCETDPSFADIRKKFGDPDFILTSAEDARILGDDEKDDNTTTYYYDYFGFKVENKDEKQTVVQVVTHANDFSTIKPEGKDASFGQIGMKNLTVFHKDGKEVGRMYFFMEGDKDPTVVTAPPKGKYKRENQVMEYLGDGRWNWISHNDQKRIARNVPFADHRMEGRAEGFYENGKPRFIANYKAGVLHGEVIQYAEDGSIEKEQTFKEGEAVEP